MTSDGEYRVRILHVSDLHERAGRGTDTWRRRRVLGEAWHRNLDELRAAGPIDLVCFTGDIADWGLPAEYSAAAALVADLMQRLALPVDRFFAVPGNHDIHRKTEPEAWKSLRSALDRADGHEVSQWLAGGEAPLGLDAGLLDNVLSRGAAYRQWLVDLGRGELLPEQSRHRRLGYARRLKLPGRPFAVHVIGLDPAWLAGDGADAGKLRLTDAQLGQLATTEQGQPLDGFRLALVHHPLGELTEADRAVCVPLLGDYVDLRISSRRGASSMRRCASAKRRRFRSTSAWAMSAPARSPRARSRIPNDD